jgi:hypothetical protein
VVKLAAAMVAAVLYVVVALATVPADHLGRSPCPAVLVQQSPAGDSPAPAGRPDGVPCPTLRGPDVVASDSAPDVVAVDSQPQAVGNDSAPRAGADAKDLPHTGTMLWQLATAGLALVVTGLLVLAPDLRRR